MDTKLLHDIELALEHAEREIISLRQRNDLLQAKVDVIEMFERLIGSLTRRGEGAMGVDAVYNLRKLRAQVSQRKQVAKEHEIQRGNGSAENAGEH